MRPGDDGSATATPPLVLAAGGVVWRREAGRLQVVLVHRPRYDDWTFPKGKLDVGESDEEAALREVEEEASVSARLGAELPSTTYVDRSGKQKRVRYWAMTIEQGEPSGANEVDVADWFSVEEARERLTYDRDHRVLEALAEAVDGMPG